MTEAFWDDAEKFRAGRSGFCFSSTRPSGARLGVTFSTNDTDARSAELFRLNGHDLTVIAQLAIECFCYLSSGDGLSEEPLSMEELRFLHTLATSPNPEKALTISSNYGGNKSLQDSIRKKLNVSTVFQAISIASSMRWFDMLPFSSEDAVRPFPGLTGWELAEDEEVSL